MDTIQEKLMRTQSDFRVMNINYLRIMNILNKNVKAASKLEEKQNTIKKAFQHEQLIRTKIFEERIRRQLQEFKERQMKEKQAVIQTMNEGLKLFEGKMRGQLQEFEEEQRKEKQGVIEAMNKGLKQAGDIINPSNPHGITSQKVEHANIMDILVCPICYNEMRPPNYIYQCSEGHPVCDKCVSRLMKPIKCPLCRKRIIGRTNTLEKIATQVFKQSRDRTNNWPRTTRNEDSEAWNMDYGEDIRELFSIPQPSLSGEDDYYVSKDEEENIQYDN